MININIENTEEGYTIEGWKAAVIIAGVWLAPAFLVYLVMA